MSTTIHKSAQTERRTRRKLLGSRVQVLVQERSVVLSTEITIDKGTEVPTPESVTAGGAVVSSESEYDPITGKTTLTTVRRTSAGSWTTVESYYEDAD